MAIFLSVPILGIFLLIQLAIASRMFLLHGTVDLILLILLAWALQKRVTTAWHWTMVGSVFVTVATALPLGIIFIGYSISTSLAIFLRKRIWQVPILAMLIITFMGTLTTQILSYISLRLLGSSITFDFALVQIVLPSLLLNILMAIPIYVLISDLAKFVYPESIEL